MGRAKGKQPLVLMRNEKSRRLTFRKRKTGLMKKMFELTTLCDIKACMICYGDDGNLETWPQQQELVRSVVEEYSGLSLEKREKHMDNIITVLEKEKKQVEKQVMEARKENSKALFPNADDRLDALSEERVRDLVGALGTKLEKIRERADFIKMMNQSVYSLQVKEDYINMMGMLSKNNLNYLQHNQQLSLPGNFSSKNGMYCDYTGRLIDLIGPSEFTTGNQTTGIGGDQWGQCCDSKLGIGDNFGSENNFNCLHSNQPLALPGNFHPGNFFTSNQMYCDARDVIRPSGSMGGQWGQYCDSKSQAGANFTVTGNSVGNYSFEVPMFNQLQAMINQLQPLQSWQETVQLPSQTPTMQQTMPTKQPTPVTSYQQPNLQQPMPSGEFNPFQNQMEDGSFNHYMPNQTNFNWDRT